MSEIRRIAGPPYCDCKKRLQSSRNPLHIRLRDAAAAIARLLQGSPTGCGGSLPLALPGGASDGRVTGLARPGPQRFDRSFASVRRHVVPSRPGPLLQRRHRAGAKRPGICGGASCLRRYFCFLGCSIAPQPRSSLSSVGHLIRRRTHGNPPSIERCSSSIRRVPPSIPRSPPSIDRSSACWAPSWAPASASHSGSTRTKCASARR